MTKIIAPTEERELISYEQIGKIMDRLTAKCRKEANLLPRDVTQFVLHNQGPRLIDEMFQPLFDRVAQASKMIVRRVRVNRDIEPSLLLDDLLSGDRNNRLARGRRISEETLQTVPSQGTGTEEFDMYFFEPKREHISNTAPYWATALEEMGLVPDYYGQIQANLDDPTLAEEHSNYMQWDVQRGREDIASYLSFSHSYKNDADSDDTSRWDLIARCHRTSGRGGNGWIAGRLPRKKK